MIMYTECGYRTDNIARENVEAGMGRIRHVEHRSDGARFRRKMVHYANVKDCTDCRARGDCSPPTLCLDS